MKIPVAFIAFLLSVYNLLVLLCPVEANTKKISEGEAVKIAEQFIAENGYTKATPKTNDLAPESFNRGRSVKDELALRYNTLEPKAYGVFEGGQFGGWGVVFKHSKRVLELAKNTKYIDGKTGKELAPPTERETGRVLMMDEIGHKCMIMHKDFFLDNKFKRIYGDQSTKPITDKKP